MSQCNNCKADTQLATKSPAYVRALWLVVAMNAAMFVLGSVVAAASGSVSVRADLLDFLSDALVTGLGLILVSKPADTRAKVSVFQGLILGALGVFALVSAVLRISSDAMPEVFGMGIYGVLGFVVNIGAAAILFRFREGEASVRAVWLYSRNDAIGNLAVLAAAALVAATASRWPDIIVGFGIAALFLQSAWEIVQTGLRELRERRTEAAH